MFNNVDYNSIKNVFVCFFGFQNVSVVKRGKRGSRLNSKVVNNIIPIIWIEKLQNEFLKNKNVSTVKNEIFKLKLKTIKKIDIAIQKFKSFKDKQFESLLKDLIAYRLRNVKIN